MSARWPAMMLRETAAEYCDMSPEQFDRNVTAKPIDQGWRGLRWKRATLDAWIEGLPEKKRARKVLDTSKIVVANEQGSGIDNAGAGRTAADRRAESLKRARANEH